MPTIIAKAFARQPWLAPTVAALAILFGAVLPAQAGAPSKISVDRAATRRICQVTGEIDRTTCRQTVNATETRFGFWGTDLGASFEHDGKLVFLFGDTHPVPGLARAKDRDIIGMSTDADPEDCLKIDFVSDGDGYRPLAIDGVDGGRFSVPTGGFSAVGRMWVVVTTGSTPASPMTRSVLASSADGRDFRPEYEVSTGRFINVAPARAEAGDRAGLPAGMTGAILLFGSGSYRKSDAYLAVLPEDRPGDKGGMRYFAGLDGAGAPRWSLREEDSRPLFEQPCIGELSAAWNADLGKWVMLYNCGAPRSRILVRTAERPWGPWSDPQVLFDAAADRGFCTFMNAGPSVVPAATGCAAVSDPHNPQTAGDPYAPYLIARFTRGVAGSYSDVYFLMSTWNPYNVVLMKARLRLTGRRNSSAS